MKVSKHLPWLILVSGGVMSAWAAWSINARIEKEARAAFEIHALDFQTSIASRLRSYEDILFGIAGLYRSSGEVTPQEFESYSDSLDLKSRFKALGVLNYAQYVDGSEREQFEKSFKNDIGPRAENIVPLYLPADRSEHMVITRIYPSGTPGVGLNLFANPRRITTEDALPSSGSIYRPNRPVSSGMPVRPPGRLSIALAARLGIFHTDSNGVPRLKGTAGIGFNVETFFKEAIPASLANRIAYRVENIGRTDGTRYANPMLIFTGAPADKPDRSLVSGADEMLTTSFLVPFGGAQLRIVLSEKKAGLVGERDMALSYLILIAGLLLTSMASLLSRRTVEQNRELSAAITLQTANLVREIDRARQLERELAGAVEEERRRIGHELHDDLGQRLTGMSLSFKVLSETLHSVSSDLSAQAQALEKHASEAISSVRGLAHGLMPVPAGPGGLRLALEQLAASVSSLHGMRCMFDFDDPVEIDDPDVATNLYRIAQEAVNNAVRHAHATEATIRLDDEDGKVTLTVADNGIGFQHDQRDGTQPVQVAGAGLRIMSHRASVINYALTVETFYGRGTAIKVQQC